MSLKMLKTGENADAGSIAKLERRIGSSLPADFRSFLEENDGARPEPNVFEGEKEDPGVGVNKFLSINEILRCKKQYLDRFPEELWPIADAEGGNYVCLAFGEKAGVCFWDHELEADVGEPPTRENVTLLTESFADFLQQLRPFAISPEPGQAAPADDEPSTPKRQSIDLGPCEIVPHQGALPLKLGMTRKEVHGLLGKPEYSEDCEDGDLEEGEFEDAYLENGLSLDYKKEQVVFIQISRDSGLTVTYKGTNVFETEASKIVSLVSADGSFDEKNPEFGHIYDFPELSIVFWRPIIPEDDCDPDGRYFQTACVYVAGYYDAE
ncbi:MAG: SMI1/KNR4 family protein [Planctomycetes bacterium]|nr:SMI1/KNR4 family protein [Planctomycetota bacterium]